MINNLKDAIILHKSGKLEEAKTLYEKFFEKDSTNFEIINLLGAIYLQLKKYDQAIIFFKKAININPNHHSLYNNLAVAYKEIEKYNDAIESLRKAIKLNIYYAEGHNNLGIIFKKILKYKEAYKHYEKAIELKPDYAEAYYNLGVLYAEEKNFKQSAINFNKATELKPDYAEAYYNLGLLYAEDRNFEQSAINFNKVVELKPDYAEAYYNLGILYVENKQFKRSIINFNKAIELNKNYIAAYGCRTTAYLKTGQHFLAINDIEKLKILEPDKKLLYESIIFFIKNQICNWGDYEKNIEELKKNLMTNQIVPGDPLDILMSIDSLKIIKNYKDKFNNNLPQSNEYFAKTLKKNKIRIAYYSSDFRRHAVSYLIANVLENHDKNNFEIIGFHFSKYPDDDMTKRISGAFNKFFDVKNISDHDLITQSRSLEIDIAIDLNGHTADKRTNIFINRIAPIQINFLGYPGTVGPYMDYIIADKYLIPNQYQNFYFEKIIYMPNGYQPHDAKKKSIDKTYNGSKFNLPETNFKYCCFNNWVKINPIIFNSWMEILKKTKNTVLCLLDQKNEDRKKNLLTEVSNRGIEQNRIIFSPELPYEEHLERFKFCDLYLDTFPYSAHTLANEVLSSGTPLLSIIGESFQSRVSSSLLNHLEIPELVKNNIKEYEDFAIHLANNLEELKKIKNKLNVSIKNSNVFNAKVYTKNLERAYKEVYDNYNANLMSKNININ